jgi:hypothetical protein
MTLFKPTEIEYISSITRQKHFIYDDDIEDIEDIEDINNCIPTIKLSAYNHEEALDEIIQYHAPFSLQSIILFASLDMLYSRFQNKCADSFLNRLNNLPENNDAEIIYKITYTIMREIRNQCTHKEFEDNGFFIEADDFHLKEEGCLYLFGLVNKLILLYNGKRLNKYDVEILKQYLQVIFNNLSFKKIKPLSKLISKLKKKLKIKNLYNKRRRHIIFCKDSFEAISICKRILLKEKDTPIPKTIPQSPYDFAPIEMLYCPKEMVNEFLIETPDKKRYLILGDCLYENIEEWIIEGNYINN